MVLPAARSPYILGLSNDWSLFNQLGQVQCNMDFLYVDPLNETETNDMI